MTDVEASTTTGRQRQSTQTSSAPDNPYKDVPVLGRWHPLNVLRRCIYMGISLYGMHHFGTYHNVMTHPDIRHEWLKIGLAASVAILFIKSYVEMYAGKLMKQQVNYKSFPQTTHSVILLLILSSVAFHKALWPVYAGTSMIIMFLVGMFLLNFCLLFPTYVQNITAFALLTFFLQEYK